ncbi:MAG: Holliday junction resolvase RuvX [bacterium]
MRILGIDLGGRRTGLALSDPLGMTCSPLEVVQERDEEQLVLRIMEVARELEVGMIVVGLPRPLAGGTNRQVESVLAFVALLEERGARPVVTWDERFTSKLAEKGRSRKVPQDAVAACYMLQGYLDSRASTRGDT